MQPLALSLFLALCAVGIFRPALIVALIFTMFPLEIALQSMCPVLSSSDLGLQAVNLAIGAAALIATPLAITQRREPFLGYANLAAISVFLVLLWSVVTLLWSPNRDVAIGTIRWQLPYMVLSTLIAPLLLSNSIQLVELQKWLLALGFAMCCVYLLSPEFAMRDGRLGTYIAGAGKQSNPLAVGEAGGLTLIIGMLYVRRTPSFLVPLIRICAVLVGSAVVFLSGSRGQVLISVGVGILFVPLAMTIRNARAFLANCLLLAVFAATTYFVFTNVLSNFATQRFSADQMVYGYDSSALSRFSSVANLMAAWSSSPIAWVVGLGYLAYGAIQGSTDIYTHVLFADAIFELGIPGLVLFVLLLMSAVQSSVQLLSMGNQADPQTRSSIATLIAIATYSTIIVNKQGALWGSFIFFMSIILIAQLANRARAGLDPALQPNPDANG